MTDCCDCHPSSTGIAFCSTEDHQAKDCPSAGSGPSCYNCGQTGHISRECTEAPKPKACYRCNETGHFGRFNGPAGLRMLICSLAIALTLLLKVVDMVAVALNATRLGSQCVCSMANSPVRQDRSYCT